MSIFVVHGPSSANADLEAVVELIMRMRKRVTKFPPLL
jgi:hypothetical protein